MRCYPLLITAGMLIATPAYAADIPAQAARGRAVFFDASRTTQCATCHQLEGKGTAIGPDLNRMGKISPRAIAIAIHATRTAYVKEVLPKSGKKFPAMVASEANGQLEMFDVGQLPPAKVTLERKAIFFIKDNVNWKHPPEVTRLSPQELADVVAYVRFIAAAATEEVKPEQLQ